MKKAKIENQEQYEKVVKNFEEKNFNDFSKAKEDAIDLELFYIKTHNDYNGRMNFLQERHPLNSLQSFIQNWRYKNNSKSNFKTDFELLKIFCKENNQNLQNIAVVKAEFEAIKL